MHSFLSGLLHGWLNTICRTWPLRKVIMIPSSPIPASTACVVPHWIFLLTSSDRPSAWALILCMALPKLWSMICYGLISSSGTVLLPFLGWSTSNYCVPQPQNPAIQRQQWRVLWLVLFSHPSLWLVLTLKWNLMLILPSIGGISAQITEHGKMQIGGGCVKLGFHAFTRRLGWSRVESKS